MRRRRRAAATGSGSGRPCRRRAGDRPDPRARGRRARTSTFSPPTVRENSRRSARRARCRPRPGASRGSPRPGWPPSPSARSSGRACPQSIRGWAKAAVGLGLHRVPLGRSAGRRVRRMKASCEPGDRGESRRLLAARAPGADPAKDARAARATGRISACHSGTQPAPLECPMSSFRRAPSPGSLVVAALGLAASFASTR